MKTCERQLRLRLDAASSEDVHVAGSFARVLEQRRLADPGLAAQDERAARRGTRRLEQRADLSALRIASVEHERHRMPATQAARNRAAQPRRVDCLLSSLAGQGGNALGTSLGDFEKLDRSPRITPKPTDATALKTNSTAEAMLSAWCSDMSVNETTQ